MRTLPFVRQFHAQISRVTIPRLQKATSVGKLSALIASVAALGYLLGSQLVASPEKEAFIVALVSCLAFLFLAIGRPVYGLVITIIAYPLSYHFTAIELGGGIPNLSADRLIIGFMAALFFFQTTTQLRKFPAANFNIIFVALLFLMAYYASFHNHPWLGTQALLFLVNHWILPLLIFFLLSNLVVNERQINVVLNLLLLLGFYSVIYMLYENLTGNILIGWKGDGREFYGASSLRITRGIYGTTTTFGNIYNLLIPIALYFMLKVRSPGKKGWYLLLFGLMLAGVFLTYKRSVWLGLILSFLIIQFYYPQFRKLFVVILLVAAVVLVISWDQVVNSEAVSTRIINTDDWQDANGRTQRWAAGMEFWYRNPLFGSGFRSYNKGLYWQTENLYVHLLASGGLALFVPFIALLAMILGNSIRIFRQTGENPQLFVDPNLMPIFWGGFSAYLFAAYFGSGVEGHPISNYLLFTIMGVLVGSQMSLLNPAKQGLEPSSPSA